MLLRFILLLLISFPVYARGGSGYGSNSGLKVLLYIIIAIPLLYIAIHFFSLLFFLPILIINYLDKNIRSGLCEFANWGFWITTTIGVPLLLNFSDNYSYLKAFLALTLWLAIWICIAKFMQHKEDQWNR